MSPLVPSAVGWMVGLVASAGLEAGGWQAPAALACLTLGLGLAVWGLSPAGDGDRAPPRWLVPALGLPALVAGLAAGGGGPRPAPLPPKGVARLQVRVVETRHLEGERARSVVRVLRGARLTDGAPIAAGSLLSVAPHPLPAGARLRLVGKLRPAVPFRNPSPHPRPPPRHPIAGRLWLPDPEAAEVLDAAALPAALHAARDHVRDALQATLQPPTLGIARALVLGEGGAVAAGDAAAVRDAGLAHVLAVSGLHVALLAGMLVSLLRRGLLLTALARRHDVGRLACALGVPIALAHASFAGGGPSAMRAATTAAVAWTVTAAGLRPRAGAVAALAVLLLGALDPAEAARPGFLLSIAATAAILTARLPAPTGLGDWLRAALIVSARTTLATAPVVLWCFGQVPLVGVAANVVILPLASVLLVPASALHALVASLSEPLATATAALLDPAARAFLTLCELFAGLAPGWRWPVPDRWQGITLALLSAGWLLDARPRRRALLALAAAIALLGLELRLRAVERPRGELRVTFLDVGQGDAALIDLPDGRALLIDAGGSPNGGVDPGRAVLVPLLAARRRAHLDVVVLSHPHPDHYGGLESVLDAVSVGELWDSGQASQETDMSPTAAEAAALLARAAARGTRVRAPPSLCGEPFVAGAATVRVLAPCPRYDSGYGANDNSLVLRIDHGSRSVLFTGDAEAHAEATLLAAGAPLRADVLKVGHHGSRTSSGAPFLRAVAPELAVISAGAVNPFGHPHSEVVERLEAHATRVLSLAEAGGTVLRSDGRRWRLATWSGLEAELESDSDSTFAVFGRRLTGSRIPCAFRAP